MLYWVSAVNPERPRLDSSSESEHSCCAGDSVYWNCSDFCASVVSLCFLAKIGYCPSVMSHWFFSEMENLLNPALSCVPVELNEQKTCRNRTICYLAPEWNPKLQLLTCKQKSRTNKMAGGFSASAESQYITLYPVDILPKDMRKHTGSHRRTDEMFPRSCCAPTA